MSKKKFQPPTGFMVAVHLNILGIKALAEALELEAVAVARGLEKAGFTLVADILDLSADAAKVIDLQNKREEKNERSDAPTN